MSIEQQKAHLHWLQPESLPGSFFYTVLQLAAMKSIALAWVKSLWAQHSVYYTQCCAHSDLSLPSERMKVLVPQTFSPAKLILICVQAPERNRCTTLWKRNITSLSLTFLLAFNLHTDIPQTAGWKLTVPLIYALVVVLHAVSRST